MAKYIKTLSIKLKDLGVLKEVLLKEIPGITKLTDESIISIQIDPSKPDAIDRILIKDMDSVVDNIDIDCIDTDETSNDDFVDSKHAYRRHKGVWYKAIETLSTSSCHNSNTNRMCVFYRHDAGCTVHCNCLCVSNSRNDLKDVTWERM
jgi:hypothetical protein